MSEKVGKGTASPPKDGLLPGEVLRLRTMRELMPNGRSWVDWCPDYERKQDDQKVFVVMLLGVEPRMPAHPTQQLDVDAVLAQLGYERRRQR